MAALKGVPRTFDDQLEALVQYLKKSGDAIPGVAVADLEKSLAAQRADKQKDLELTNAAKAFHVQFTTAQADRYALYMKAVGMLRVLYRDKPEKLTQLSMLKRAWTKRTAKETA